MLWWQVLTKTWNAKLIGDWCKLAWPITYLLITQDTFEQSWLNSLQTSCALSWTYIPSFIHIRQALWWWNKYMPGYFKQNQTSWSDFVKLETHSLLLLALISTNWAASYCWTQKGLNSPIAACSYILFIHFWQCQYRIYHFTPHFTFHFYVRLSKSMQEDSDLPEWKFYTESEECNTWKEVQQERPDQTKWFKSGWLGKLEKNLQLRSVVVTISI